jgi:hypothetical protein
LAEHSFPRDEIQPENFVIGPKRVELGPAVEILERVVWSVIRAPAQKGLQVATGIVVLVEKLAAGSEVVGEQLTFEPRPSRRRHWGIDDDRSSLRGRRRRRQCRYQYRYEYRGQQPSRCHEWRGV